MVVAIALAGGVAVAAFILGIRWQLVHDGNAGTLSATVPAAAAERDRATWLPGFCSIGSQGQVRCQVGVATGWIFVEPGPSATFHRFDPVTIPRAIVSELVARRGLRLVKVSFRGEVQDLDRVRIYLDPTAAERLQQVLVEHGWPRCR